MAARPLSKMPAVPLLLLLLSSRPPRLPQSTQSAETPDFYLYRIIDNPAARLVKCAVIDDDLDPVAVTLLDPVIRRRLLDKNGSARDRLLATSSL